MEENQEVLEKWSLEIKKIISSLGFNARVETVNTVEAFLGRLPGHNIENVRRFFIHSLNTLENTENNQEIEHRITMIINRIITL